MSSSFRPRRLRLGALALIGTAVLLAACGDKKERPAAAQTAARVNKTEISQAQVNLLTPPQRGLKPEQFDALQRQVLERMIDQELLLQKADDANLERDPRVVKQLELARREILARAWLDKLVEALPKPTPDELHQYYVQHPELFAERRIYQVQELAVEARPEQVAELRERLGQSKSLQEFTQYLQAHEIRFASNPSVRAAEQLPPQSLKAFARMQDGQALMHPSPEGLQVVALLASRLQPVSEEQAGPLLEQALLNERRNQLAADELRRLRAAARIRYGAKYAASDTASNPSSASPAASPTAAATEPLTVPLPAIPPATAPASAAATDPRKP